MNDKMKKIFNIIILNILFLFITGYLIFQYFRINTETVGVGRIEAITREESINADGYILKNEYVIRSGSGKYVDYHANEGKKIGKDQLLATIYDSSENLDGSEKIIMIENKINLLEKSNINIDYMKNTSVERIDKEMSDMYLELIYDLKNKNLNKTGKTNDDMLIALNKRQIVTQKVKNFDDVINSLKSLKSELLSGFPDNANGTGISVYAPLSGIFYSDNDGYEEIFTVDALKNLTSNKFDSLINSEAAAYDDTVIGKIIKDYKWYVICKIDKKKNMDFKEGYYYALEFEYTYNKKLTFRLNKKIDDFEKNMQILVFETSEVPDGFNFLRNQPVKILYETVNGIKVPEGVIRVVTDGEGNTMQGAYILKGNIVKFKRLYEEDCIGKYYNYYIYKENDDSECLKLHDIIITSGKNLYDGKIVN